MGELGVPLGCYETDRGFVEGEGAEDFGLHVYCSGLTECLVGG